MTPSAPLTLWCDGAHDAPENMQRDATLLARASAGELPGPVVRVYRFAPHGITLGRAQDPEVELDVERCTADGIAWAIRPTGGRAIFHAHEWTFAHVLPPGSEGSADDARTQYARTCEWLARALEQLGVPVTLARGEHGDLAPRRGAAAAPGCFASTARHELLLEGRKFAGIAQRESGGAWLQQGSLLLGDGHLRLADYQRLAPETRATLREALAASAAHAGAILGAEAALERFADALGATGGAHVRLDGAAGLHLLGAARV